MLRGVGAGLNVCVTVTLADGIVLARSVFNHSMNYRSVVALGIATLADDPAEKIAGAASVYGENTAGTMERRAATE